MMPLSCLTAFDPLRTFGKRLGQRLDSERNMKPHLNTVCLFLFGVALTMVFKWVSRVYIFDKTYEFPDGLIQGAVMMFVFLLFDQKRRKRLRAEPPERQ